MMRRSPAGRFFLLVICMTLFTDILQAQFRGSLRGTVTDPRGAAISGAKATLVNTDTNLTLVSISDANGLYQFNALPSGLSSPLHQGRSWLLQPVSPFRL